MTTSPMQDRRIWIGGAVLVAILLVAASWLLLIGPKLDSADSLQSQSDDAQFSNQQIAVKNNKLRQQAENIGSLQKKLRTALAGLPADNGFDTFTTEVSSLAAKNRVKLTSVTISPPASQAATAPATTTPSEGSGDSGASAAPAASAASGVLTINVTLTTSGTGDKQDLFLKDLQNGDRRVIVTSSQLAVSATSRVNSVNANTTMTTQLTMFSSPMSADQIKSIQHDLAAN